MRGREGPGAAQATVAFLGRRLSLGGWLLIALTGCQRGDPVHEIVRDLQQGPRSSRVHVHAVGRKIFEDPRFGSPTECPIKAYDSDEDFFVLLRCRDGSQVRISFWGPGVDDATAELKVETVVIHSPDGGAVRVWLTDSRPPFFNCKDELWPGCPDFHWPLASLGGRETLPSGTCVP